MPSPDQSITAEETLQNIKILIERAALPDLMQPYDLFTALQSQCAAILEDHITAKHTLGPSDLQLAKELQGQLNKVIIQTPRAKSR